MTTPLNSQRRGINKELPLTVAEEAAAKRLKELWAKRAPIVGLTQKSLAKEVDVNPSLISQYMNGHIPLNLKFVLLFSKALEVPPVEIYPELSDLYEMAKTSQKLRVTAIFTKDNRKMILRMPEDIEGWMSPSATAKAIRVDRDYGEGTCPTGTIVVYEEAKRLDHHYVMSNSKTLYVCQQRNNREELFIARVDRPNETLVDIDGGAVLCKLDIQMTTVFNVHPVIAKMCLNGIG